MKLPEIKIFRTNFARVTIGGLTLWFSYETCIGFKVGINRPVASENVWGPTTGRHLNEFSSKDDRIPRDAFEEKLNEVLSNY